MNVNKAPDSTNVERVKEENVREIFKGSVENVSFQEMYKKSPESRANTNQSTVCATTWEKWIP